MKNLDRINPKDIAKYLGTPVEVAIWAWHIVDKTMDTNQVKNKINEMLEQWQRSVPSDWSKIAPPQFVEYPRHLCLEKLEVAIQNLEFSINRFPNFNPTIAGDYLSALTTIRNLLKKNTVSLPDISNDIRSKLESKIGEHKKWKQVQHRQSNVPWPANDNFITADQRTSISIKREDELAPAKQAFLEELNAIRKVKKEWISNDSFILRYRTDICSWLKNAHKTELKKIGILKGNVLSIKNFLDDKLATKKPKTLNIEKLLDEWSHAELVKFKSGRDIPNVPSSKATKLQRELRNKKLFELATKWKEKNVGRDSKEMFTTNQIKAFAEEIVIFCENEHIPVDGENINRVIRDNLHKLLHSANT